MQRVVIRQKYSLADIAVVGFLAAIIAGLVSYGREWKTPFHSATEIDLSLYSLPYYTFFSAMRGTAAFLLSLAFTLSVGYWAAKSKRAEKILIPMLDILQSIPVLGFLPGLVLALIALFPKTNTGLELSSIIMIFTGQVWNMTFSYYSSLKSVPNEFHEVSRIIGLSPWEKLKRVEIPFSAMNLVWNSLMSMSGGWFFLSVCEAFTLGSREYRLPGIGAYMAVAINRGDTAAMIFGILAMVALIVVMDFLIWRPVLAWAHRFRLEDIPGYGSTDPMINNLIGGSRLVLWIKAFYRQKIQHRKILWEPPEETVLPPAPRLAVTKPFWERYPKQLTVLGYVGGVMALGAILWGSVRLVQLLATVPARQWLYLVGNTGITFLRVAVCLAVSSLWAVPVGIWIGTSAQRIRIAQPIIQVMASFPAPMLYPLVLTVLFALKVRFSVSAMFLMLLGVQWYVLFNVLAGAMRVPSELKLATVLMGCSRMSTWKKLYLPSVFPSLVTGWVTAAGGAWNASIVAETLSYRGSVLMTRGLGASISLAATTEDFGLLAASLTIMVVLVIVFNRAVWARLYELAQTRFKLDA